MTDTIGSALGLSVRVSLLATALTALVGLPLAWILARRRFWGRQALDVLVTLPLVLPPTVTGYYLIVLLGRRGRAHATPRDQGIPGPIRAKRGASAAGGRCEEDERAAESPALEIFVDEPHWLHIGSPSGCTPLPEGGNLNTRPVH